MSRLALVETRLALHAELGAFHPVEHEQRAFDAPDLADREIQAVLLTVGAELAQHRRGLYGHGFDTGRQPQGVVPVLGHDLLVDRLAHEGGELLPPPGSAEARQPTIRKVAQTRSKGKAEQVEQGEDASLAAIGWESLIVWECETVDVHSLKKRLRTFLDGQETITGRAVIR